MRDVSDGSREALGELYDRFVPRMLSVTQEILRSRQEAEDLVHNVFLEAWQCAQSYDPKRGSVSTWLLLRTRSRALDRLRVMRKAQAVEREVALLGHARGARDAASVRDGKAILDVLTALPLDQRAVLELSYFAEHSHSEIATRLEIPIGTVKSRIARALDSIRALLRVTEARS